MKRGVVLASILLSVQGLAEEPIKTAKMHAKLATYVQARQAEFGQIPASRRTELDGLAGYVEECLQAKKPCRLNFICTHNSRRSHLAQLWAATSAAQYGLTGVWTYSGGTEATAFNPRAVAAIKRAGFQVRKTTEDTNPVYHVSYSDAAAPLTCFSKVFNQSPNPKSAFCAVMTCAQADQACPVVHGAAARLAIAYEDPKVADGTPAEATRYDERCRQIAREMLYVFSRVAARRAPASAG